MRHQLAAGEDLPGIQHPAFQQFNLRLRRYMGAPGQPFALRRKGHGEFQRPDAGLILRCVEDRHPDGAGDAVLLCAAVETDHSLCRNDPGDVRAVIRDDGLRCLLLGQRLWLSQFVCIQTLLFQFKFHVGILPFRSVYFSAVYERRRPLMPGS